MYYEKDIKETNMRKRIIVMIFAILAVVIFAISCGKHKHSYTEEVVPPTCTERGYTKYTCECGDEYLDNFVDPAHTFTEEAVAPTCGDKGYTNLKCSVCGYTEKKEGSEVAATGNHTWEWVVGREATCTKEGISRQQCTVCKQFNGQVSQKIAKKDHEFEEKIIKEPTCTESGTKAEVCKICGTKNGNGVTIDALGHDIPHDEAHYVEAESLAPSCKEQGYKLYRCSRCDYTEKDYEDIVPHTKQEGDLGNTVDPTCITDGYTEYTCSVCGQTFRPDGEKVPATGVHGGWIVTDEVVAPTCSEEGYTVYRCGYDQNCTETTHKDFIERTAHSFVDEDSGIICCTECGHEYSDIMYEKVTIPGGDITGDPTLGESGITVDISGEKPGTPITLTGTTPLEIAIPEGKSADEGIVRITTDDDTVNYTVEIQVDGNWTEVKSGLSGSDIFVDLYKYTNITAIRVTADAAADATITIYA